MRDAGEVEHRSPEELLGKTLGTCTLERILGRGGMGVVYLAQQTRPHRQVAVKALLLSLMPDPDRRRRFLQRFRREADAVAVLEHPNILPIYEYGEQADLAYLVMPYVAGGTLRDRVERKGALPLPEVAGFLAQAAAALDYAHAHGVIHRDVKPQNMLLYPDKRLMLGDFGIAKVAEQAASDGDATTQPQLTTMGHVVGTPDYIAPEQAMGQPVDGRADIYSLGVVLYYMVTGRVPFAGAQPMTVAAKHVSEPPPPPRQFRPDLPVAAEQVILKALAKSPADRYRTAGDFSRAFRAALPALPEPIPAPPPNPVPAKGEKPPVIPQQQPVKGKVTKRQEQQEETIPVLPVGVGKSSSPRRAWVAILAAVLIVLLIAGGAYAVYNGNKPQPTPTTTATTGPTATPTQIASPSPTVSPTATATATTTPLVYQADNFLPKQSDMPANAQLLSPQTANTPQEVQGLPVSLVVDPTKAQYNWQKEIYVEADQNGNAYLKIVIGQFTQASDAQNYYNDVGTRLQSVQHQRTIGQQEAGGQCCDANPDTTTYNVIFQDQNIVVIILIESASSQAISDGLDVGTAMDNHGRQPSAALRPTLPVADLQGRWAPAA